MKSIHLVIPDLFLPEDIAAEACVDLRLPALEKLLGRGHSEILPANSLESLLCGLFGVTGSGSAPIASVSAAFDGLPEGYWLRADPVHLRLQRDQMLLLPNQEISAEEAESICASLNEHFSGQGMEFFAPHPLRWYVRFDVSPDIETVPLSQAFGRNVHGLLPRGEEGKRWHQLFNEIQMLLYAHPLNDSREQRGKLPINSLWLWGNGTMTGALQKSYDSVSSDEVMVEMFAAAVGVPFAGWSEHWQTGSEDGRQLLVWTGLRSALQSGDLSAWRAALQDFETGYAQPLLQALRSGRIDQLQLEVIGADNNLRVMLKRGDTWAFWRRIRRLPAYSSN